MSSSVTNKEQELLVQENPNRFVTFPIMYEDIWEMVQLHRKAFWNESEIDVSNDLDDWNRLTDEERTFIKSILAFFAASDGIVLENLALRFIAEIQIPEVRSFYTTQMYMEMVHGIMYSQLIDTYIEDAVEKDRLFRAIDTMPSVKRKATWAQKWILSDEGIATRIAAFACVEGLFFSGSFCCIYWLKERGVLSGLCKSNDFIAKDEALHCDFACLLYNSYIQHRLTDEVIHAIVGEAVSIEMEFITESIQCDLLGMNAALMKEYIRFVANRLLKQLGHAELFPGAKQPFSFMDRICFDTKDNFFEGRVTSYQMTIAKNHEDEVDHLSFNADF